MSKYGKNRPLSDSEMKDLLNKSDLSAEESDFDSGIFFCSILEYKINQFILVDDSMKDPDFDLSSEELDSDSGIYFLLYYT